MSNESDSSRSTFVSEEDAHLVLARAVELDSRAASGISLAQLRAIASEAGIGSEALEQALGELRSGRLRAEELGEVAVRSLSDRLRYYRPHVTTACAISIATITRGDHVGSILLYTSALSALYEICIRLAGVRERGGPSSQSGQVREGATNDAHRNDGTRSRNRLLLRLNPLVPSI